MRYAKLESGIIHYAPKKLTIGANNVWNPTGEQYEEAGYKVVEYTTQPEAPEGYYYASGWEEQENAIVQTWTLEELPADIEIDDIEALGIILGELS